MATRDELRDALEAARRRPRGWRRAVRFDVVGRWTYEVPSLGRLLGQASDRAGEGAAAPFHFEPTQLGQYLLLDPEGQLLAAEKGASEQAEDTVCAVGFHAPVGRDTHLTRTVDDDAPAPLAHPPVEGNTPDVDTPTGAVVPGEADPSADWRARHNLDGTITLTLPALGLTVRARRTKG